VGVVWLAGASVVGVALLHPPLKKARKRMQITILPTPREILKAWLIISIPSQAQEKQLF
jgi:hypothetical protein